MNPRHISLIMLVRIVLSFVTFVMIFDSLQWQLSGSCKKFPWISFLNIFKHLYEYLKFLFVLSRITHTHYIIKDYDKDTIRTCLPATQMQVSILQHADKIFLLQNAISFEIWEWEHLRGLTLQYHGTLSKVIQTVFLRVV